MFCITFATACEIAAGLRSSTPYTDSKERVTAACSSLKVKAALSPGDLRFGPNVILQKVKKTARADLNRARKLEDLKAEIVGHVGALWGTF